MPAHEPAQPRGPSRPGAIVAGETPTASSNAGNSQSPPTRDRPSEGNGGARRPSIPDYELIRRIGSGAYGDVWLARSATGVLRALKIVYRSRFEDDRPFQREFEGIQKFERVSREHPGQLALFHVGRIEAEGYFYYVMELADEAGKMLDARYRMLDHPAPHVTFRMQHRVSIAVKKEMLVLEKEMESAIRRSVE